jgi:hypothetical protein
MCLWQLPEFSLHPVYSSMQCNLLWKAASLGDPFMPRLGMHAKLPPPTPGGAMLPLPVSDM